MGTESGGARRDKARTQSFALQSRPIGECAHVVSVRGEIDAATASRLRGRLFDLISQNAVALVVDLRRTSFVASACLTALLQAHKRLSERGGAVSVICTQDWLLRALESTGLRGLLRVHAARKEAEVEAVELARVGAGRELMADLMGEEALRRFPSGTWGV